MVDVAQAILQEAGWDETSKQIVTGIKNGVEEEKPVFLDALTQMALEERLSKISCHSPNSLTCPSRFFIRAVPLTSCKRQHR